MATAPASERQGDPEGLSRVLGQGVVEQASELALPDQDRRRAVDQGTKASFEASQAGRAPDREKVRTEEPRVGRFRVGSAEWQDVCASLGDGRGMERISRHEI